MRDALNFNMLPIVQDNMNDIAFNHDVKGITNLSSNGYYGYQPPPLGGKLKIQDESMKMQICDQMDVQQGQFEFETRNQRDFTRFPNRKRAWEHRDDFREFKKRRQNDYSFFSSTAQLPTASSSNDAKLRKPTHNIPDMPRCIMDKIENNGTIKKQLMQTGKFGAANELFEELLKETHGCSIYHWNNNDL